MKDWPLKTAPADYLERKGLHAKHSALALEILAEQEEIEFELSAWQGMLNYHCPICPHASLDLDDMRAHVRGHGRRPRPGPSGALEGLAEEE